MLRIAIKEKEYLPGAAMAWGASTGELVFTTAGALATKVLIRISQDTSEDGKEREVRKLFIYLEQRRLLVPQRRVLN